MAQASIHGYPKQLVDEVQQIINDAKPIEAGAIRSEDDAQKAYEDFVKDINAPIEEKSRDIADKSEEEPTAVHQSVESELHQSCDIVLKNFDVRQTARDEEVEALKQAKAILSGAKFEEFLQSA